MRPLYWLASLAIVLNLGGMAEAVPCFGLDGTAMAKAPAEGIDCALDRRNYWRPKQDEVLARDSEGNPLFKAYVAAPKKKKGNGFKAIADMNGRLVTPAEFETVYVITPTLGVGERRINVKDPETGYDMWRAFLIDLTTGEIRPTPYRTIYFSEAGVGLREPVYLLGVLKFNDKNHPVKAAILSPGGTETGLVVESEWQAIKTHNNGILSVGEQLFTANGEPPAGGHPLYDGWGYGYLAEIGTAPAEMTTAPRPLYVPLNNVGQLPEMPENLVGYVRGRSTEFWEVRRDGEGFTYYKHPGGQIRITEQPVGKAFPGVYISEDSEVIQTPEGWMHEEYREVFPTAQLASADTDAKVKAFITAMWADIAEQERARKQAEIDAANERVARAAAEREMVLARIEQAAKEGWQGYNLQDLKRDVIRFQLEGRYEAAGLYIDPEMRREICWSRQSVICSYTPLSASSSSGYVSTWEKAFENASALNKRQYQERCASAFNGYGALCTSD